MGGLRLDKQTTDLSQLARNVIQTMETLSAQHRLVGDLPAESLVTTADARRIEQVLRNLLDNAIKYSPEGGTITVQGYQDESQILFSISDEGIGIPSEEWERIFERFHRVENDVTRRMRGAGLGLAVCRGHRGGARRPHLGREPIGRRQHVLLHTADRGLIGCGSGQTRLAHNLESEDAQ